MNNNTKFIIGGGISGLIFAYYNRDYQIISPDVGGKLKNDYLTSTILLHDTTETKRLISDLGLDLKPKTHLIRYYYKGKVLESIPVNLKETMIAKKLTPWDELKNLKLEIQITDATLSTNDIYIPVFRTQIFKIIKALAKEVKIIKDKVIRITPEEIVTEKARYEYSEIVSTIPAPVFWELYGRKRDLKYIPETFLSETNQTKDYNLHWDLIYFLDKNVPYTRVNKYKENKYLYEFTGAVSKTEARKLLPNLNILHLFVDPYGIIITDLNNIPPPKVRFLGRFATWNHSHKIQDVVRESLARYDFVSLWNKQKDFNSNFFDFNIKDIELQQKLTKDFVLHVEDEAHELLSEINWKMAQYRIKDVDRAKLLEEWIDIFKYWLGIGNVWGFTLEDFFNEFWRKSKIVDERYKKYMDEEKKDSNK
ncbi:MAG: hypothetical protein ACOYT7_00370 [Patescibacteria group bacterium]